jgi:hypothetical protein
MTDWSCAGTHRGRMPGVTLIAHVDFQQSVWFFITGPKRQQKSSTERLIDWEKITQHRANPQAMICCVETKTFDLSARSRLDTLRTESH